MKFQLKISKFEIFKNRTYIVPFLPLLTKIVKNHEKNQFSFICYCGGPKKAFGAFIFKKKVKIDETKFWNFQSKFHVLFDFTLFIPFFSKILPFLKGTIPLLYLPFFVKKKGKKGRRYLLSNIGDTKNDQILSFILRVWSISTFCLKIKVPNAVLGPPQ